MCVGHKRTTQFFSPAAGKIRGRGGRGSKWAPRINDATYKPQSKYHLLTTKIEFSSSKSCPLNKKPFFFFFGGGG